LSQSLRDASREVTGREIVYDDASLATLLSPRHFVDVRKTPGGPAPSETLRAVEASQALLRTDETWLRDMRDKLTRAERLLRSASAQLS
jgi:argininosuccinate lyase